MAKQIIEISPRALRDLQKFPPTVARKILDDIGVLAETPWPGPPKVKKLKGYELYRLRTGSYRSVFEARQGKVVMLRIVDRKELERILETL